MLYFYKLSKRFSNTGYYTPATYGGTPYSYKTLGEEFSIYNQDNLAKAKITIYHNSSGGYVTALELTNNINASNVTIKSGSGNESAYVYGFPFIFCSTLNYNTDNQIEKLPQTTISGRYKFKTQLNWGGQAGILGGATIPVQVSINGVTYKNLILSRYNTWKHAYEVQQETSPIYLSAYSNVNDPRTTPSDFKTDFVSATGQGYGDLSDEYVNMLWDFGNTEQEVPTAFKTWVEHNADYIYPNTYTIKNASGDTILDSINAPPIQNARLSVLGNTKTLVLTSGNRSFTLEWASETPENLVFIGLTNEPNSNRVVIPTGIDNNVYWAGDIILYECYGKYRPPQTTFGIILYQNTSETNRVDKSDFLTPLTTLTGALREECSILTPSIVYQSSEIPTFNYVYIPIFNRYYFVTQLASVGKKVWRMELNCDVLMSYKEQIYTLQGVIGRQENDFNPLLVDNELPTQNNPIIEIIDIPSNAFNTQTSDGGHNFLLTVIGA